MAKSLKTLVQSRNGYRLNVNKQLDIFADLRENLTIPANLIKIKVFLGKLQLYHEKLELLDSEILEKLDDDTEIAEEIANTSDLRDTLLDALKTAEILVADLAAASVVRQMSNDLDETSTQRGRVSVKLPQLDIETYGGDPMSWQEFWDSFESTVHSNPDLPDIDKYKYLRRYLRDDASKVIEGYRLTASNYSTVVEALKYRFGNPELAIFAHFEQLNAMPSIENDVSKLRRTYDECEMHIRSLVALGLEEGVFGQVFTPMILSKLPRAIRIQLHRRNGSEPWKLATLRSMMKDEIKAREMSDCYSKKSSVGKSAEVEHQSGHYSVPPKRQPRPFQQHHSVLASQSKAVLQCCFCAGPHYADKCSKFVTVADRKAALGNKCFKCLGEGHDARSCPRQRLCFYCRKDGHHSSLCFATFGASSKAGAEKPSFKSRGSAHLAAGIKSVAMIASGSHVQMQMAVVTLRVNDRTAKARIFFDTGSTRSYMTTSLQQSLAVPTCGKEIISLAKFANSKRTTDSFLNANINIPTLHGPAVTLSTLVTDVITCPIQKYPLAMAANPILAQVPLADPPSDKPTLVSIDILVGADHYYDIIGDERIELSNGALLIGSKLGYVVSGKVPVSEAVQASAVPLVCHDANTRNVDIERFWKLEEVGIKDDPYRQDDERAQAMFDETVRIIDGRYEVTWPWRCGKDAGPELPTNYGLALGRLNSLLKRLKDKPMVLAEYDRTIRDQLQKGVIERVDKIASNNNHIHYIPHHCVIRENKATTKLRIVYDASAKASRESPSLNDCLLRGPVILQDLCGMLLRFRLSVVAMVSDVEKAFLQVGIQPHERDVTRFIWPKDPAKPVSAFNLQIYRFARVPFGFVPSPFLLAAAIRNHLDRQSSEVAADISGNLYVDNIIGGRSTSEHALEYYKEAKRLLSDISMNVREWYTNSVELRSQIPEADKGVDSVPKVLGVEWNTYDDTIACMGADDNVDAKTKRHMLKVVSNAFDPCGLVAPVIIRGKWLVQEAWRQQLPRDKELPQDIYDEFRAIQGDLTRINSIKIPRVVTHDVQDASTHREVHCFSDASIKAYASVCYLKSTTASGWSTVNVIFAKARLAPIKPITIPRLELMATVIGCRMTKFVVKELRISIDRCFLWTDSKCVLRWIKSSKTLPVFVQNRVKELNSCSDITYRYVPTTCNPADLPSRGVDLDSLRQSDLWWHGPQYLKIAENLWPENDIGSGNDAHVDSIDGEITDCPGILMTAVSNRLPGIGSIIDVSKYSSMSRLLRITAWVMLFIDKCRQSKLNRGTRWRVSPGDQSSLSGLTTLCIGLAEQRWVQHIQSTEFGDFLTNKAHSTIVHHLGLYTDASGILRCRGRLRWATISDEAKEPKLLPKSHPFTDLVISHCHEKLYHAGVRQTLAQLRLEYWVSSGLSQVRRVLRNCRICRRAESRPFKLPESPPLPWFRVAKCFPFEHVGIDYLGPLLVGDGGVEKVWICLFTCAATRAVHLEVITDATADQFLLSLRRFSAVYGAPTTIVSDNARHFKLVSKTLHRVVKDDVIQQYSASAGINWKFITELAPWMGGFYERMVGSVKRALRKSINKRRLTLVQLQTVIAEVSAIINSRPLVPISADVGEHVLTPAHFLAKQGRVGLPEFRVDDDDTYTVVCQRKTGKQLLEQWASGQKLLDNFWKSWQNEYLTSLRDRPPPKLGTRNSSDIDPRPGVVVLIKDKVPRGQWKMGRIVDMHQGSDGKCRSSTVQLPSGTRLKRAIKLLYPLEEDVPIHPQSIDTSPKSSRSGTPMKSRRNIRNIATRSGGPSVDLANYRDDSASDEYLDL